LENALLKPTAGQIVWYYPPYSDTLHKIFGSVREKKPLAALIAHVWSDTCVNLTVIDPNGNLTSRTSVLLHQGEGQRPDPGFAEPRPMELGEFIAGELSEITVGGSTGKALPPLSDAQMEGEIRLAGADQAPRVTPAQIDALLGKLQLHWHHFPGTTSIVAIASMPDGFVVGIGHSACVSRANFKAEIGEQIATDNALKAARDKLWELEGYLLRDRMRAAQ
jgi:hypothetical protein